MSKMPKETPQFKEEPGRIESLELIEKEIEKNRERILDIRHKIHKNPELGFREFKTAKLIKKELERIGVEIVGERIGKTGIVARIKGKEGGKTVALRADIDALPIQEKTDIPFASKKKNIMHACGHDTHTAALLGAAGVLEKLSQENRLGGDVLLIFQPNEERTDPGRKSGAVQIIHFLERKGLRQDINAIFALHVLGSLERGKIKLPEDIVCAASSSFKLTMEAPGGHVSNAYKVPNIEKFLSRIETELDNKFGAQAPQSERPKVILEPGLHKTDSQAVNILSKKGEVNWTLRILLPGMEFKAMRTNIIQELKKIILDVVGPWEEQGVKWSIDYNPGTRPVTFRDPKLVKLGEEVAKKVLGEGFEIDREPLLGGEDFSYYLEPLRGKTIHGIMMLVGGASPKEGIPLVDHHRPNFKVDEEAILDMAKIYAELARRYLKSKE